MVLITTMKLIFVCVILLVGTDAAKFLLVIMPSVSHFRESNSIGVELLNRGHQVDILFDECFKANIKEKRYTNVNLYKCTDMDKLLGDSKKIKKMLGETAMSSKPEIFKIFNIFSDLKDTLDILCSSTIGNKNLLEKLKSEKYDYILLDGLSLVMCLYLLPDYLGVPHMTVGTQIMLGSTRLNQPFMNFVTTNDIPSRLLNFATTLAFENVHNILTDYDKYRKSAGFDYKNPDSIAEKSELWILNQDFLLQPPQSLPPHVRPVGGLSLTKPLPLKQEYKTFADKSTDGFIIVTFGSNVAFLPEILAMKFVKAFKKIPFNVVMRLKGEEVNLFKNQKNVLIRSWLPQNDLLAHPNCRLFISHCGNNGNFEALYNGVPVIGFPVLGDQAQNAQRIEDRGYGIKMDLGKFTVDELVSTIMKVASHTSPFRKKISAASKIYRRQKPAAQRAADAIEEALRGETKFYFPEKSYQLTALQYNNVDLIIIVFLSLVMFVCLGITCCCYCLRWCVRRNKKDKHD